jgi:hypothetical protein
MKAAKISLPVLSAFIIAGFLYSCAAEFRPSVVCTKMACMEQDPCCNSCLVDNWYSTDQRQRRADFTLTKPPDSRADGCGRPDIELIKAWGMPAKDQFYVFNWKVKQYRSVIIEEPALKKSGGGDEKKN